MQRMQRVAIGLVVWALTARPPRSSPSSIRPKGRARRSKTRTPRNASCGRSKRRASIPLRSRSRVRTSRRLPNSKAARLRVQPAAPRWVRWGVRSEATRARVRRSERWPARRRGLRQRRKNEAAAGQQQANNQQASQQMATFNRAVGACMTGRGYTVQ